MHGAHCTILLRAAGIFKMNLLSPSFSLATSYNLHPNLYESVSFELTEMAGTVHQLVELEVWQSLQNLHSWEVRADGYAAVEITFLVAVRCCSFHLIYLSKTFVRLRWSAQHHLAKFSCHLPRLPLTKKVILTDILLCHSKFKAQAQKKSQNKR